MTGPVPKLPLPGFGSQDWYYDTVINGTECQAVYGLNREAAYFQGMAARAVGAFFSANPYLVTEYAGACEAWSNGWNAADRIATKPGDV